MTPENLFVAPEGALQFEITRDWDGNKAPPGLILWVVRVPYGDKDVHPECPHEFAYKAFPDSIPAALIAGQSVVGLQVCECVGRIIE